MGQTNELAGGNELNLILSKRLDIGNAPAPFSASEIFPTIALEVDRPEWKWLGNERLCTGAATDPAVAGQYSNVGLANPADSGAIIVLERLYIANTIGTHADFRIQLDPDALAFDTGGAGFIRDSRAGWNVSGAGTGGAIGQVGTRTNISRPGFLATFVHLANGGNSMQLDDQWIIHPGNRLWISAPGANNICQAAFFWRERRAQPGELIGAL